MFCCLGNTSNKVSTYRVPLTLRIQCLLACCYGNEQGSCGHGKPGKVMEFEKSISRPGEVMEN